MTWSLVTNGTQTWGNLTSHTTLRNTSRFILLSPVHISATSGVNFQPAIRSVAAGGRGGAFYVTSADPIALHNSGESTI